MMRPDLLFEAVNGALFVICLWGFFVFTRYIWNHRHEGYIFLRPAIAFDCIFAGEAYLRLAFWWVRREINRGDTAMQVYHWWTISGTIALMIAAACCIRIFDKRGSHGWLWAIVVACLFVTLSIVIPYDWPNTEYVP